MLISEYTYNFYGNSKSTTPEIGHGSPDLIAMITDNTVGKTPGLFLFIPLKHS